MRIAFISQPRDAIEAEGTQNGSVAIVTWELARRLAQRHDVTVHAPRARGQVEEERGNENVRVRRTSRVFRRSHKVMDLGTGLLGLSPPYFAWSAFFHEYAAAVAAQLARDSPDVIHIQVYSQFIPAMRRAVPKARIVLHTHDELLTRLDPRIVDRRLALADAVVTCSEFVTRRLQARFPRRAARIHTIGNGVDTERFHPVGAAQVVALPRHQVLFVGRVSPEKGVHVLARAFEAVLAQVPDAFLTVIGSAGLLPYNQIRLLESDPHVASLREFYGSGLLQRIRKQVLEARHGYVDAICSSMSPQTRARVEFRGPSSHEELPALYQGASLLVAPSLCEEPFGLPLAEAMASGLPVIASRAGGMCGIVEEGRTGRLVERGDVRALAEAMISLLRDPQTLAGMGRASREAAETRFGWTAAAERLENVYQH